jgi:hypothetical protein
MELKERAVLAAVGLELLVMLLVILAQQILVVVVVEFPCKFLLMLEFREQAAPVLSSSNTLQPMLQHSPLVLHKQPA